MSYQRSASILGGLQK
jgi:hypothetical protein